MNRFLSLVLLVSAAFHAFSQNTYTISGYVMEASSGEHLPGVSIYVPNLKTGTVSNTYGFYSLTIPKGKHTLTYFYVGYKEESKNLQLLADTSITVLLSSEAQDIEGAQVIAKKNEKASQRVSMSNMDIPIKQIKEIPTLLGEKDVLKVLQLMPGVQSGGEGQSGLYVRGGGPDQNLIILDDANVYNASHLFGFFSLFNGDALKSVELIKGGFPARYGGRLSSVIDMSMKDGNRNKYTGELGIGLISSRGVFEGPIPGSKGKGSFIISGRRTYIDALLQPVLLAASNGEERGGYFFHDLNAKVNYDITDKDRIFLSGYFGRDKFYVRFRDQLGDSKEDVDLGWGNATGTFRWNRLINQKTFSNLSLIYSKFDLGINANTKDGADEFSLNFGSLVRDWSLKYDLDYYPNLKHSIKTGFQSIYHTFSPNAVVIEGSDIPVDIDLSNEITAFESGLYVEDTYKPTVRWTINAGMRFSHFYQNSKQYFRPEPRLAVAYKAGKDFALKASYAAMNQYIHLLSNTGIGLPTDLWVPTADRVRPQNSRQIAAGIAKDFDKIGSTLTIEGYYKTMNDILGYKEGASFLAVEAGETGLALADWQENVTAGQGWSYGAEVFFQKKYGDFSGWVGYTLSWTELQFDDLNSGKKFWARYDRRHDISLVGIYKLNKRVKFSGVWVYGTGNAISVPRSEYQGFFRNEFLNLSYYGDKNDFRMRPYHRLDLGIQFSKTTKNGNERMWEISAYNAYNRANPFYYFRQTENPDGVWNSGDEYVALKQVTLFPIIPSISYSLKFN